jgi:hypothetical protein
VPVTPGHVLFGAEEVNLDACRLEIGAAMSPLAIDPPCDRDAGAAKGDPEEFLIVAKAGQLVGYADPEPPRGALGLRQRGGAAARRLVLPAVVRG